jgi:hypothetical protein
MEEPNILDKAKNLGGAMVAWAIKDGFARVPSEIFHHRKQFCDNCVFWDKTGYAGLGLCRLCGCSVAKLYIPSSKCPDRPPHWLNIQSSDILNNVPLPLDNSHKDP